MREMLADLSLMNGDPVQALADYPAVLANNMNRFDSLYGAESSAFAVGDVATARVYYKQLLAITKGAERQEVVTARARGAQANGEITP